ncbi:MAG: 3-deoxy-7-phosphoheptulonate synthase [Verrucomicrobiae bacterium]|nr:3-deoxy-7-phosphoheptulonate synthase [Verrucomicrobiae bacterium]
MIVVLKPNVSKDAVRRVIAEVEKLGYKAHPVIGELQTIIAAIGDETAHHTLETLTAWPEVESVLRVQKRYKLVTREGDRKDTHIKIQDQWIGAGKKLSLMAGPCSVESEKQTIETAIAVKEAGATILRGGAFKPRTSPYEFQGLGKEGLKILAKAKKETGLAIITELLSESDAELVAEYADILQIGARNAQNFQLLIRAAKTGRPILLKRGLSERIEEWMLAAEYILANGNPNVFLCERGIRTFETFTRNTLDLSAVAIAKKETHLPVIVDPSQGCGRADLVIEMCKAAIAIGTDGLLIEVHPNPAEAWSDGQQQLDINTFKRLVKELEPFIQAVGRPQ